jgi:hypothetical protein
MATITKPTTMLQLFELSARKFTTQSLSLPVGHVVSIRKQLVVVRRGGS